MKNYIKELVILVLQLLMFYIFPLFAGPTDAMGMVFLILVATLVLSILLGCTSRNKIKYLYPAAAAILFLPSVLIYYNKSALIHALWYLVISAIGMLVGSIIHKAYAPAAEEEEEEPSPKKWPKIVLAGVVLLMVAIVSFIAGQKASRSGYELIPYDGGPGTQTFYATIERINENHLTVKGMDVNDINFRGNFSFTITDDTVLEWRYTELTPEDLDAGDHISVTFSGLIQETDPAGISDVIRIQLLDDEK